ncbi:putative WRKY transcription factor 41, partial [Mucuna pruriens]
MGSDQSWENDALVNELIQGMEVARKLKEDLSLPSSVDSRDSLLQRILSSYDKALLILRWNASITNSQTLHQPTKTTSPQSSVRDDAECGRKDHQQPKHNSKKRKMMPKWTEQIKVKMANGGVEGPLEDGYRWRKYGQKDILSAKYPRSYYRCRFRNTKGCYATKQVQRSEEEASTFDITYRGSHTCNGNNADEFQHAQPSQESLTNKYTNTFSIKTDNVTAHPFGSSMTQHNHTLLSSLLLENNNDPFFDGLCNKDSDVAGIVSAHTSTTTFPIFDFNFSLDAVGIDSNFPFNASGFLS